MDRIVKRIEVNGNTYECNVSPSQIPAVERMLRGTTDSDVAIQAMSIPDRPLWLKGMVSALRWYQRIISPRLRNRCVFEPSCSHYSELAFREKGLLKGFWLTVKRLYRCRPGVGGIDLP
jgi:putative membrane protein insertion efficiency factor